MQKTFFRLVPRSVWCCMAVYVVAMSALCVYGYIHFFYAGLDLGIYDQVLWNTAHGRLFAYSFNPYSYLVDHREWLLLVLAPLYWVVAHPVTLLIVQTVAIASGAIPLYLLARKILGSMRQAEGLSIGVAVLYLMHPSVQQMNLFEFHVLTFALPLSLWLWLCIEQRRWLHVWVFLAALLLLREDVGLMTAGVGVLCAVADRSLRKKGVIITAVSLAWVAVMIVVGSHLAPDGTEKFLVFYRWLGNTPMEIVHAILTNPARFFGVFLGYDHVVILVFLAMDVVFLALWAPKYLIPAVLPLLLYLSLNQDMLAPVIKTHYAAVLIPWFMIAALHGFRSLALRQWFRKLDLLGVSVVIIIIVAFLQYVSRGPLLETWHNMSVMQYRDLNAYTRIIDRIQPGDAVMASSRFYPHLSERTHLYTTMHTFTGKQHFADVDYTPPEHLDWIILEQDELLSYEINLPQENRDDAWKRLQTLIDENHLSIVDFTEDVIVYGHASADMSAVSQPITQSTAPLAHSVNSIINTTLKFVGWEYASASVDSGTLTLALERLPLRSAFTDDEQASLTWTDAQGVVLKEKSVALGNGVQPTHMWGVGDAEQRHVSLPITQPQGTQHVTLTIGRVRAQFGPFFTVWKPGPILDPDHSTSFDLTDLLQSAALEK